MVQDIKIHPYLYLKPSVSEKIPDHDYLQNVGRGKDNLHISKNNVSVSHGRHDGDAESQFSRSNPKIEDLKLCIS